MHTVSFSAQKANPLLRTHKAEGELGELGLSAPVCGGEVKVARPKVQLRRGPLRRPDRRVVIARAWIKAHDHGVRRLRGQRQRVPEEASACIYIEVK